MEHEPFGEISVDLPAKRATAAKRLRNAKEWLALWVLVEILAYYFATRPKGGGQWDFNLDVLFGSLFFFLGLPLMILSAAGVFWFGARVRELDRQIAAAQEPRVK